MHNQKYHNKFRHTIGHWNDFAFYLDWIKSYAAILPDAYPPPATTATYKCSAIAKLRAQEWFLITGDEADLSGVRSSLSRDSESLLLLALRVHCIQLGSQPCLCDAQQRTGLSCSHRDKLAQNINESAYNRLGRTSGTHFSIDIQVPEDALPPRAALEIHRKEINNRYYRASVCRRYLVGQVVQVSGPVVQAIEDVRCVQHRGSCR
jgi:hypothetical protein